WGPVSSDSDSQLYQSELDETVRKLGLVERCRFHGPVQDVERVLSGADCLVIPSTNEPCSVALIEALAMGVPAIASASGGNVDIVQAGRTGLLFEPESAISLAECFRRVLRNEIGFGDGKALRESVRERSASSVGAKYLELYGRLVRPHISHFEQP
ncbi:MAG: glycosyltransferase family 4 protein, partial [Verrucomicrobiia bacterium]